MTERKHATGEPPRPLRLRPVDMNRVRPLRWLWERRIPLELLSLLVGEESAGKGTLIAWVISQATRGTLPGDLHGQPINVLIIGDEDGFERIWVPRLHLAGADLTRVRTLADGEDLDDLGARADALAAAVRAENVGWVILDALLDHVDGGHEGTGINNPKHVRRQLAPLRAVAAEADIAITGLMHPVKGSPTSFRDLLASSHQFNAVSRSSLWLGPDPSDADRRILVRGKGNHTAEPRSVEFAIQGRQFELNGHAFEMPRVVDVKEGDRTIKDLLGASRTNDGLGVRHRLALGLAVVLNGQPTTVADLARSVGRDPKDKSVRDALEVLRDEGIAEKTDKGWKSTAATGGVWGVVPTSPTPPTPNPGSDPGNGTGQDRAERLLRDHADIAEATT
jgi:hypothetical protein